MTPTPIRHIRIPDDQWQALHQAADRNGVTIAVLTRAIIRRYLDDPKRKGLLLVALATVVLLLTTGCSANADTQVVNTAPPVGTQQDTHQGATYTVYQIKDPAPVTTPPDTGKRWVALDVGACLQVTSPIRTDKWAVVDKAGHIYNAYPTSASEYPDALYPDGHTIPAGQCARGWIVYQVAGTDPIVSVQYTLLYALGIHTLQDLQLLDPPVVLTWMASSG